ncbi:hypothetical protein FA13DRAFT_1719694 [Coprinellus micaceus]|uniref:Uncharacterized protein n=1 Tax=Coprinellus micaceus TaxID=71717 RepID=A0A4Y7SAN1_COPMI|nr:hypothetical protein FA13DRAFT_1719694 [Coprinellus micaceus]
MVGWIPPAELRLERYYHFLQRIQNAQSATGPGDTAFLLHYDARSADLLPYAWPALGSARVAPNVLDWHRHTHFYMGPPVCLVQRVEQPGTPECLGQYAATCAKQRCGYYGDTAETVKRAGLRQIEVLRDESNTGLRGTRHLLRREDPERFWQLEDEIEKLLTKGLPGTKFWDLFMQCAKCNYVMPAHHFPYYHECAAIVIRGYEITAFKRSYRSTVLTDKDENDSNMAVEPVEEVLGDDSDDDLPTLEIFGLPPKRRSFNPVISNGETRVSFFWVPPRRRNFSDDGLNDEQNSKPLRRWAVKLTCIEKGINGNGHIHTASHVVAVLQLIEPTTTPRKGCGIAMKSVGGALNGQPRFVKIIHELPDFFFHLVLIDGPSVAPERTCGGWDI